MDSNETKARELLPCPFCGTEAEYRENPFLGDNSMAVCRSCGAQAYWRKWNTRIHPQPTSNGELEPWIVWSNEHRAFWAPNRCGYTARIEKAGRYTRAEAETICNGANYRANSRLNYGTPPEICMPAPEALSTPPASNGELVEKVARAICLSQGHDPDDFAPRGVMCTADNEQVTWWHVFTEEAEAAISAISTPPASDTLAELREALRGLITAVRFADPPRNFGTEEDPNLCHEARVPIDFVTIAEAALAKTETPRDV